MITSGEGREGIHRGNKQTKKAKETVRSQSSQSPRDDEEENGDDDAASEKKCFINTAVSVNLPPKVSNRQNKTFTTTTSSKHYSQGENGKIHHYTAAATPRQERKEGRRTIDKPPSLEFSTS